MAINKYYFTYFNSFFILVRLGRAWHLHSSSLLANRAINCPTSFGWDLPDPSRGIHCLQFSARVAGTKTVPHIWAGAGEWPFLVLIARPHSLGTKRRSKAAPWWRLWGNVELTKSACSRSDRQIWAKMLHINTVITLNLKVGTFIYSFMVFIFLFFDASKAKDQTLIAFC